MNTALNNRPVHATFQKVKYKATLLEPLFSFESDLTRIAGSRQSLKKDVYRRVRASTQKGKVLSSPEPCAQALLGE